MTDHASLTFRVADIGNALLESMGGFFISISIVKLYHEKLVRGVSWAHVGFFTMWGWWNIYYYWAVGSAFSWYAGMGVTFANTIYFLMMLYYTRLEHRLARAYLGELAEDEIGP